MERASLSGIRQRPRSQSIRGKTTSRPRQYHFPNERHAIVPSSNHAHPAIHTGSRRGPAKSPPDRAAFPSTPSGPPTTMRLPRKGSLRRQDKARRGSKVDPRTLRNSPSTATGCHRSSKLPRATVSARTNGRVTKGRTTRPNFRKNPRALHHSAQGADLVTRPSLPGFSFTDPNIGIYLSRIRRGLLGQDTSHPLLAIMRRSEGNPRRSRGQRQADYEYECPGKIN